MDHNFNNSITKRIQVISYTTQAVMAEWLRRLTGNQMGSSRAGSNPADRDTFINKLILNHMLI